MMRRGFTLIEVLVTMAIISILAGIMVPAVYQWWESQEEQTTRERLNALKLAMVGDRSLIQNGIRTSYGFVGDNGELPFGNVTARGGLKLLVEKPSSAYPFWNGPYMSGFDPSTYSVDAWGRSFRYTVNKDSHDRYVSGKICSAGLNGILDDNDDICVKLEEKEVTPTARIQGNFISSTYSSARIELTYRDPAVPSWEKSITLPCKPAFSGFTTLTRYNAIPINIPIGKIGIKTSYYKNPNCVNFGREINLNYFVSDGLNSLYFTLPTIPGP